MPITVVCPGCRKRFSVSDKFAGKQGPCPKCKTVIKVPAKSEEVVVHAPEDFGPKDSAGRAVLKPIERKETRVSPLLTAIIVLSVLAAVTVAWMFRSPEGEVPTLLLLIGALALAPPLVWSGYAFLRDAELEAFQGRELLIRVAACSAVYAALWGLVALVTSYVFQGDPLEVIHMAFIAPAMVAIGAFGAYASLDFDFTMAAVHYGLYLLVTVTLRLIMGLSAF
jgi:cation transport ATPase